MYFRLVWVMLIFLSVGLPHSVSAGNALHHSTPEPNPPHHQIDVPEPASAETTLFFRAPASAPTTEWTYHKTADGLHPDGNEQQMLWLLNRARSNPTQEGIWLATMDDPDVVAARNYFGVDLVVLQNEFAAIPAKPPAAFDARLYRASKAHSDYLIATDSQSHDGQLTRVNESDFQWSSWAGIVFSYSRHTVYGHAGFNIDWGNGTDGTQDPPGHRNAIMSVNADYSSVGYAVVPETNTSTAVGPQVITGNLCRANTSYADHYNRFIVGTVWKDANGNSQYDPGEGLPGVNVTPDKGVYFAVTADSGGFSIPILAADTYALSFSGGSLAEVHARSITVGSVSVLQDLLVSDAPSPPPKGKAVPGIIDLLLSD